MTFRYDESYVSLNWAYPIDPALPLLLAPQQTAEGRAIFGAFSDSAPDRWGRRLIQRSEARRARELGKTQRRFGEFDYLLGVRDEVRQGALRFLDPETGVFLASEIEGVPPLVDLPRLLSAAENLDLGDEDDDDLELLLRGGSSLGGARPKAHVADPTGNVAIAKFPSPANDTWDVMGWEYVAMSLARRSGIDVATHELMDVDGKKVLLMSRFDRRDDVRIGYASALTMLDLTDGDQASYLEIAEVVSANSPVVGADLEELWRRMAFGVLISNFDDHLRNHGFLRTSSSGWRLSPAFDLNPDPRGGLLSTSIDMYSFEASVDLLMEVAPEFRLSEVDAIGILREVSDATGQWRQIAQSAGLSDEISLMAPAFENEQAEAARALVE